MNEKQLDFYFPCHCSWWFQGSKKPHRHSGGWQLSSWRPDKNSPSPNQTPNPHSVLSPSPSPRWVMVSGSWPASRVLRCCSLAEEFLLTHRRAGQEWTTREKECKKIYNHRNAWLGLSRKSDRMIVKGQLKLVGHDDVDDKYWADNILNSWW